MVVCLETFSSVTHASVASFFRFLRGEPELLLIGGLPTVHSERRAYQPSEGTPAREERNTRKDHAIRGERGQ